MIGAEFFAEAVEIGTHFGRGARPGFGKYSNFRSVEMLESFGYVRVATIRIGGVEETQAVVVTVQQETRETADAQRGLMRVVANADGSGAHSEARGLNAGAAERDGIGG
jgi:hypothetical protein